MAQGDENDPGVAPASDSDLRMVADINGLTMNSSPRLLTNWKASSISWLQTA